MLLFFIVLVIISFYVRIDHSVKKKGKAELDAVDLHCDMSSKLRELMDDPFMSSEKWKEWLPIFQAADERCKQLHPKMASILGDTSVFVKRIIDTTRR